MTRPFRTVLTAGRQRGEIATLLVIAVVAVALIFGGYKLIGVAADALADRIPDAVEAKLFGELGARQGDWTADPSTPDRRRAATVFKKLSARPGLRELPYTLRFDASKEPNAFAVPGGTIVVTDGLLDLVKSEVGLATVVAHEFGHTQKRHALRQMGRSLLLTGILMVLVGDPGTLAGLAMSLAENAHSREQELEADDYGLRMVHAAYGTTKGALEFFTKIAAADGTGDLGALAMLSTHPQTPDRIARLKALAHELDAQNP
jgi:Zn-dependent protease with chaperone function